MDQIQQHFSQAAQSYENHSLVQKHMAEELYNLVQPHLQPGRIMEYGVGTGHLSALLAQDPNSKELEFVDFALPMLFQAQMRIMNLGTQAKTNFIESDIESHNLPTCASTYISNATIQWLKDFPAFLSKSAKRLDSGSIMAFSAFGTRHFEEFYSSAADIFPNFNKRQVRLYSLAELNQLAEENHFEIIDVQSHSISEEFNRLKDILDHIKKMGAQDKSSAYDITPNRWRAWQKKYPKNSQGMLNLLWEYHLCIWKRK